MALTPGIRRPCSSADDDGGLGDWSPTDQRSRDRRKTTRLYRNWDTFRPSGHQPGSALPEISANGFSEDCVRGRFEGPVLEPTIERISDYFRVRLNAAPGEHDEEFYPASVLLGKFMQLGADLLGKPHPHFYDGGFVTPEAWRIFYRLVILPFA
jgi:hypothetical protein